MYDYVLRVCLCVYQSVVSLLCGQGLLKKILTPAGIKPSTETPPVSVFYRAYLNISAFFFFFAFFKQYASLLLKFGQIMSLVHQACISQLYINPAQVDSGFKVLGKQQ